MFLDTNFTDLLKISLTESVQSSKMRGSCSLVFCNFTGVSDLLVILMFCFSRSLEGRTVLADTAVHELVQPIWASIYFSLCRAGPPLNVNNY